MATVEGRDGGRTGANVHDNTSGYPSVVKGPLFLLLDADFFLFERLDEELHDRLFFLWFDFALCQLRPLGVKGF